VTPVANSANGGDSGRKRGVFKETFLRSFLMVSWHPPDKNIEKLIRTKINAIYFIHQPRYEAIARGTAVAGHCAHQVRALILHTVSPASFRQAPIRLFQRDKIEAYM
jgi:hypothetical protein